MRIEEFEFDFSKCFLNEEVDRFKEGVIYKHSESGEYYIKYKAYNWDHENQVHTNEWNFDMCWLPEEVIDALNQQNAITLGAFEDVEKLKAQYKESLKYDSMKAQMWCDIAREKDIDSANKALRAFDEIFEAKK